MCPLFDCVVCRSSSLYPLGVIGDDSAGGASGRGGSSAAGSDGSDYRVAVFGAGGVGKSSLTQRFVKGTFSDNYVPTIEDTYRQVISCNQKSVCTLQITDTTGSHQFPAMQRLSVSKGHAFVLVYAVTSRASFEELIPIVKMIHEVKGSGIDDVPVMLVGNKNDEPPSKRQIPTSFGEKASKEWKCGFIETSAKNNDNVQELFQKLLAMEKKRQLQLTMDDGEGKNAKKKKCTLM
ncbi:drn-1 [Pristionchus pacificus]|uniref:Drn-1 n=1 Tax=Pristionchus pacificus TaxID=54126 RepID=A0A2A6CXR8_PRIPA|nr:drn-1 [Pristionchus pacificus]|eukprot:PDM82900.1 drn-1 [Pristionchus pacificus]